MTTTPSKTEVQIALECGAIVGTPGAIDCAVGLPTVAFTDAQLAEFCRRIRDQPAADTRASTSQPAVAQREPQLGTELATALRRFADCCEDSDADGHDVRPEKMEALAEFGVVRKVRGSVYELTIYGQWLLERGIYSPAINRAWQRFQKVVEEPNAKSEQELKVLFKAAQTVLDEAIQSQTSLVREAVVRAQNRHGGLRAAARSLKIDAGYLQRLKSGEKANPSDAVLRKLRLK